MPLSTLLPLAMGIGVATALVGGSELRRSPRHALLTATFRAFFLFLILVLLPISIYFYVFHGDWFLLYAFDVRRIPSAIALIGFLVELALGVCGFMFGAALARAQRAGLALALLVACGITALAVVLLYRQQLGVVGTFSQYRGDYGLKPYGGALMQGTLAFGAILLVGTAYLLGRVHFAQRRE